MTRATINVRTLINLVDENQSTTLNTHALCGRHLRDCPNQIDLDGSNCQWCEFALITPAIEQLVSLNSDATTLLEVSEPTVSWIAAVDKLCADVSLIRIDGLRFPSAKLLAAEILRTVHQQIARLSALVEHACRPDGPIEQVCIDTSALLCVAALANGFEATAGHITPSTTASIIELCDTISPERVHTLVRPLIDAQHWKGLPILQTQPEWTRLPAPMPPTGLSLRQLDGLEPGSLEAFVLEAVLYDETQRITSIAKELASRSIKVKHTPRSSRQTLSSNARRMTWPRARIDWVQTYLDSTATCCWPTDPAGYITMPWCVATAIGFGATLDYESATHVGAT